MKIGIVGTHHTGKSTLVKSFIEKHPEYKTSKKEESRVVVEKGLGINFETSLASQEAFLKALLSMMSEVSFIKDCVSPRTLIDLVAYNLYFFRRPQYRLTQEFMNKSRDEMLKWLNFWDLYIYLPIEFPITEENKYRIGQKDNPDYQKEVDTYIQALLMNYDIPYITITGTVEERITKIE